MRCPRDIEAVAIITVFVPGDVRYGLVGFKTQLTTLEFYQFDVSDINFPVECGIVLTLEVFSFTFTVTPRILIGI